MPWKPDDAQRHDKKARSGVAKRQWADAANSVLGRTGDEGRAVREANAAVMKRGMQKFHGKLSEASQQRPRRRVVSRYA